MSADVLDFRTCRQVNKPSDNASTTLDQVIDGFSKSPRQQEAVGKVAEAMMAGADKGRSTRRQSRGGTAAVTVADRDARWARWQPVAAESRILVHAARA
jgi:hypothetical protein